jgi:hypothetical protein
MSYRELQKKCSALKKAGKAPQSVKCNAKKAELENVIAKYSSVSTPVKVRKTRKPKAPVKAKSPVKAGSPVKAKAVRKPRTKKSLGKVTSESVRAKLTRRDSPRALNLEEQLIAHISGIFTNKDYADLFYDYFDDTNLDIRAKHLMNVVVKIEQNVSSYLRLKLSQMRVMFKSIDDEGADEEYTDYIQIADLAGEILLAIAPDRHNRGYAGHQIIISGFKPNTNQWVTLLRKTIPGYAYVDHVAVINQWLKNATK